MGLIVISKGEAAMLLKMDTADTVKLWAEGVGETKGTGAYPRERVTADFVMRAVVRLLVRCDVGDGLQATCCGGTVPRASSRSEQGPASLKIL